MKSSCEVVGVRILARSGFERKGNWMKRGISSDIRSAAPMLPVGWQNTEKKCKPTLPERRRLTLKRIKQMLWGYLKRKTMGRLEISLKNRPHWVPWGRDCLLRRFRLLSHFYTLGVTSWVLYHVPLLLVIYVFDTWQTRLSHVGILMLSHALSFSLPALSYLFELW